MNPSTLVMLAALVLFVLYMAFRRNRPTQEAERTHITGGHQSL